MAALILRKLNVGIKVWVVVQKIAPTVDYKIHSRSVNKFKQLRKPTITVLTTAKSGRGYGVVWASQLRPPYHLNPSLSLLPLSYIGQ